ncbi:hypothetical protein C1H46_014408 [Malus baccata]|uniref:Uncharacterized protein n=1 Tax=Malus baccata TaxID=106549 RepID=A0A540MNR3_MALBA|nr:hypothetical protein C1H46_014408 [Malus baccata]
MPVYNLASKILCRVINVSLKAEPDNDEVFAQVTLLPESNVSWLEDYDLLWAGKTNYGLRFWWFDVINFSKMRMQWRRK